MTARIFTVPGSKVKGVRKAERSSKKGGQDTSRTPIRRKAEAFPGLHAGASVDGRAARTEKDSSFNEDRGTTGLTGMKAGLP